MEVFMSWHDVVKSGKIDESDEEAALRDELQKMLGLEPVQHPGVACHESLQKSQGVNPDTVALAQSLYREAVRRSRTASVVKPLSRRHIFALVAAALPVLFVASALGTWGVKQKRRADALAVKTLELESRQNPSDSDVEEGRTGEDAPLLQASESPTSNTPDSTQERRGNNPNNANTGELIKPDEQPRRSTNRTDQYRVSDPQR
jgi:hypothetical protein